MVFAPQADTDGSGALSFSEFARWTGIDTYAKPASANGTGGLEPPQPRPGADTEPERRLGADERAKASEALERAKESLHTALADLVWERRQVAPRDDAAGAPSISASIEVTSAAMSLDRGTNPRVRRPALPQFLPRLRSRSF